jgi:hypothetical protein
MSPYTFPCAHRLPRTHTHRHKSGIVPSCGIPFKAVLSTCYDAIPLKGFFSFFLLLSAIPREIIQHSDSPQLKTSLIILACAGSLGDIVSCWLIRDVSPVFAVLQLLSWIGMWVGYGGMMGITLWDRWFMT